MNSDDTNTTHNTGPSPVPREARQRADEKLMRFLVKVCQKRAYAQAFLILDQHGGHFTTRLSQRIPS